jgi:hypothetical protein
MDGGETVGQRRTDSLNDSSNAVRCSPQTFACREFVISRSSVRVRVPAPKISNNSPIAGASARRAGAQDLPQMQPRADGRRLLFLSAPVIGREHQTRIDPPLADLEQVGEMRRSVGLHSL